MSDAASEKAVIKAAAHAARRDHLPQRHRAAKLIAAAGGS
jgi:hypothetical protein